MKLAAAFRAFFALLFKGFLPDDLARELGYVPQSEVPPPAPPKPEVRPSDGALQLLAILQRDARLVDFVMEDISGYSDDQVGAAVRNLHDECRKAIDRYVQLTPVIDGIEGTTVAIEKKQDPARLKLLGNVPASGRPSAGILRHRGWRAERVDLPPLASGQDASVLAPAEIEVE